MFDAQCDLASVVYAAHEEPDRLLLGFVEHLRRTRFRVVGLLQRDGVAKAGNTDVRAVMLPGKEAVSIAHDRGPSGCRLAAGRIAGMADVIAAEIERGADLVVLNRFGKLEAAGQGFIDLITQAVNADIPVLIAVPEHRFATWIKYSGGMNVRLPCRRAALDRWWRSVGRGQSGRRPADTFCDIAK
jgi:nucleoside-triphosphatase THEP1